MNQRQVTGSLGEEFAASYLRSSLGWEIVVRNWRCRAGELDIVAIDGSCLVVVEVRTRRGVEPGAVAEAVTTRKLRQVYRVIRFFLSQFRQYRNQSIRVDVVALRFRGKDVQELIHVKNALTVDAIGSVKW
jgi:putative endonuclease